MELLLIVGIVFFVLAVVAYFLGAQGIAGMSADIGKWLVGAAVLVLVIILLFRLIGSAT